MMRRAVLFFAVAVVALSATQSIESRADLGSWRVTRELYTVQDFVSDEALTVNQARHRLSQKAFSITERGPKSCSSHREVRLEDRNGLLAAAQIPLETNLGLPEKVTVFEYDCFELWLRSDGNAIAGINGYYFELRKSSKPSNSHKP